MSVELLNIDCMTYMAGQRDKSFDLIIVDPPYFEVKGEFDFIWGSFDDYLSSVELWAVEIKRLLKDSGSLLWWGNSKKIAYTQIILDKYFSLENSLVWEKKDSQQYQYYSSKTSRSFNTHNERLLYYSSQKDSPALGNPFPSYLKKELDKAGVSIMEIAQLFPSESGKTTGCVYNWIAGLNIIQADQYLAIKSYLGSGFLTKNYDEMRQEYESRRRSFNNDLKLTEVLSFNQQATETSRFNHPTQKAPKLSEALVRVVGRRGGKALIPFAGSGTEVIACANFGMSVVGCETSPKYYATANARINDETKQTDMFSAPPTEEPPHGN